MTAQQTPLSLPPDGQSLNRYVREEWAEILKAWRSGYYREEQLNQLNAMIQTRRSDIAEGRLDPRFDWERDYGLAGVIHIANLDFVSNRRVSLNDTKTIWREWCDRQDQSAVAISVEALKAMILLTGAAIVTSVAVLSGQVASPKPVAETAARIMLFASILSMVMIAAGHAIVFERATSYSVTVRAAITGNANQHKIFALNRYLTRYFNREMRLANGLIYGSMIVFAFAAFVSAMVIAT